MPWSTFYWTRIFVQIDVCRAISELTIEKPYIVCCSLYKRRLQDSPPSLIVITPSFSRRYRTRPRLSNWKDFFVKQDYSKKPRRQRQQKGKEKLGSPPRLPLWRLVSWSAGYRIHPFRHLWLIRINISWRKMQWAHSSGPSWLRTLNIFYPVWKAPFQDGSILRA